MRRNISAILLLMVFVSLQFGKVASYIYCKWQAEIIQNKSDCGCNDHLVAMFEHQGDNSTHNDLAKHNVSEKLNEFAPKGMIDIPQFISAINRSFTEYDSPLSESFPDSPFHPPII